MYTLNRGTSSTFMSGVRTTLRSVCMKAGDTASIDECESIMVVSVRDAPAKTRKMPSVSASL
jgi:hypothetical protein